MRDLVPVGPLPPYRPVATGLYCRLLPPDWGRGAVEVPQAANSGPGFGLLADREQEAGDTQVEPEP
jgi:hypothetical protein